MCWGFSFYTLKRVLAKGKQKYVEKKKISRLSPDPVKRTVGGKKEGVQVQLTLEVS